MSRSGQSPHTVSPNLLLFENQVHNCKYDISLTYSLEFLFAIFIRKPMLAGVMGLETNLIIIQQTFIEHLLYRDTKLS